MFPAHFLLSKIHYSYECSRGTVWYILSLKSFTSSLTLAKYLHVFCVKKWYHGRSSPSDIFYFFSLLINSVSSTLTVRGHLSTEWFMLLRSFLPPLWAPKKSIVHNTVSWSERLLVEKFVLFPSQAFGKWFFRRSDSRRTIKPRKSGKVKQRTLV